MTTFITDIIDGPHQDPNGQIYLVARLENPLDEVAWIEEIYYDTLEEAYEDIELILEGWIELEDEDTEDNFYYDDFDMALEYDDNDPYDYK